jgi:hypothetical protein
MSNRYKAMPRGEPVLASTPLAMKTILELDSIQSPLNVSVGETIKMNGRKFLVINRTGWRAIVVPVTAVNFDPE